MPKLIDPHRLSPRDWSRLASLAGITREDWGEGWLRLDQLFRGDHYLTESLAVAALRRIAEGSLAALKLPQALAA